MRQAPGPFPKKLPDIAGTACAIQREVIDRPDIRLTDMSIGQLILDLSDGTPAYLTGSNVWLRSIFGRSSRACLVGERKCTEHARQVDCICQERLDYDVVLSSKESAERFIDGVLSTLDTRLPKSHRYERTMNAFGSDRLVMPDGTPIVDAWFLQEGESIHELLMGYPEDHQRSAYYVSHSPTPASLIRLARPGLRSHAFPRMDDRYPGRPQPRLSASQEKQMRMTARSSYLNPDPIEFQIHPIRRA